MVVKRGDIFFVRRVKGSVEGSEQDAERPAVVVSNDIGNQHAPIVEVVYLTTQEKKPMPTHVNVMCRVPSIALCEQVHTVYKDRLSDYIRTCTEKEMAHIDSALMTSLGLNSGVTCNEEEDSKIEELKNKLECALNSLNSSQDLCESYEKQIAKLGIKNELLKEQNERLLDRLVG